MRYFPLAPGNSRMNLAASRLVAPLLSCLLISTGIHAAESKWTIPRDHGPSTRKTVALVTNEKQGTIIISTEQRTMDVVLDRGHVERYKIGVGRDGFTWSGTVSVGRKAEWPTWRPPAEMRHRDKRLPEFVPPGPHNPLGARALYLHKNGSDTLYRIHGTNDNESVGGFVSSGCFRLSNKDILYIYNRVSVGAKVIVR